MKLSKFCSILIVLISIFGMSKTDEYDFDQQKWILDTNTNTGLNPGHRSGSITWQEDSKTFWVFGGEVFDEASKSVKLLNDLWKLDLEERKWTKMHEASTEKSYPPPRQMGAGCGVFEKYMIIFGGLGNGNSFLEDTWIYDFVKNAWISYSENHSSNESIPTPPSRADAASWCTEEYMIIFSGVDVNQRLLTDMWYFSLNEFNWEETTQSAGITGKDAFISLMSGFPKPRTGAVTWKCKNSNSVYLFGGNTEGKHFRAHDGSGYMSDLWQYSLDSHQWQYLKGHTRPHTSNYSVSGIPLAGNLPGSRHRAAAWTDTTGDLWMTGGEGLISSKPNQKHAYPTQLLTDFWHFRPSLNQWVWVGGRTENGAVASTGEVIPPGRTLSLNFQIKNIFYIYGGKGVDDKVMRGLRMDMWYVDQNAIVYWPNHYKIGSVVGLVFLGFGLIFFVIVTTIFSRKKLSGLKSSFNDVKYTRLGPAIDP